MKNREKCPGMNSENIKSFCSVCQGKTQLKKPYKQYVQDGYGKNAFNRPLPDITHGCPICIDTDKKPYKQKIGKRCFSILTQVEQQWWT